MRLPLTLRLAYYTLRIGVLCAFLATAAWIMLVPATSTEQAALNATTDVERPLGLVQMRTARIIMAVAPDRFYDMAAQIMGDDVSPILVRAAIAMTASGALPPGLSQGQAQPNSRSIDGPRFVTVD